jgi:hypothetical protein
MLVLTGSRVRRVDQQAADEKKNYTVEIHATTRKLLV